MTTRPDLRSLPLGLKRYTKASFDRLHAAGSGAFTASLIPALFGESRFHGAFAAMAHVKGLVPLPEFGSSVLMERGNELEEVAVAKAGREKGWHVCHHIRAWAPHPSISGLAASPDAIAWRTADGEPGVGEVKVVADMVYQDRWLDGSPLDVELQHQTQLACTGASWGFIVALVVGAFRWDLVVYETERHEPTIKTIEAKVRHCHALLAAGDMGPPDEHPTSIMAMQRLWAPVAGKVLSLNDPEADQRLETWLQARADRLAWGKVEDAQQRWFAARALDHDRIACPGGGYVKISNVKKKGHVVAATEYRKLEPKEAREES